MSDYVPIILILLWIAFACYTLWRIDTACDRIADIHKWMKEDEDA